MTKEEADKAWKVIADRHEERQLQATGYHTGYGASQSYRTGISDYRSALKAEVKKRTEEAIKEAKKKGITCSKDDPYMSIEKILELIDTCTPDRDKQPTK